MNLEPIKRIWRPEVFHGLKKGQFEGWYYKIVNAPENYVLAFIPGISMVKSENNTPHAFIQIFDGIKQTYHYHKFDIADFWYSRKVFHVRIGENEFRYDGIVFKLSQVEQKVVGELKFNNITPWPVKLLSPGAIGPLAFIPRLQNYHGILSLDHEITGILKINGKTIDFNGGRGYIEKDWGKSHPSAWIWMQSNNFREKTISLTAAIANGQFLRRKMVGFIIGFLFRKKLYTFTSYNRSKITNLRIENNCVSFQVKKGKYALNIRGMQVGGVEMLSPSTTGMDGKIKESLTSKIEVQFFEKKNIIFEGIGEKAGLEWRGAEEELIQN
jgi:tocopherol cyclase